MTDPEYRPAEERGSEGQLIQRQTSRWGLLARQLDVELVTPDQFVVPFDPATGEVQQATQAPVLGTTGPPMTRSRPRGEGTSQAEWERKFPVMRGRVRPGQ